MSAPFFFEEEVRQVYYHNIRVFVSGADVTPWLTSSVSIKYADRNGMNSCTFSLSNAYRSFEITSENVLVNQDGSLRANRFRESDPYSADGKYSEKAKALIFNIKNDPKNQRKHAVKTFGPVKTTAAGGRILSDKNSVRNANQSQSDITLRYPMFPGSLIFHKYDPVRVFVQDPLQRGNDRWYMAFTGYIDTKPYSQNYTSGESTINVVAQDIRMLMHSMRTQNNPMARYGNENTLMFGTSSQQTVKDTADAGFFNDLHNPKNGHISHIVGGQTFEQSIEFLLFGFSGGSKVKDENSSRNTNLGAIGNLKKGVTLKYDASAADTPRKALLEKWNNIVLFGPGEKFVNYITMEKIGAGTYDGGPHSPDNAQVHFLYPKSGSPPSNLIEFMMADGQVDAKVEWGSRYELIAQICKNVDYQFYVSGTGDIIIEFPMYDFLPPDFNPVYNNLYAFDMHAVSDNMNDEGGTPVTALVVTSQNLKSEYAQNNPESADSIPGHASSVELKRTIFSNVLASRVGVHVETMHLPGITNQDRLTQLAMIEFNKRLANYNKFDLDPTYRPFIHVNRPIYHKNKERIGIVESITYAWAIRGEVTMSMDFSYVRRREADGNFRFITGGERTPISYSTIYDKAYIPGSGVNATGSAEGGDGKPVNSTDTDNNINGG
jgi:hypothetical protein